MIDRCVGKDAMAEVEDMARPTLCFIKNPLDLLFYQIRRTEENDRIEVPLYGDIVSETGPCLS
jgi:hypothetical protein